MTWTQRQYDSPPGQWGWPSDPVEQSTSADISSGCVRGGTGGATKEMLFIVLLSRSRSGLTVGKEFRLECERKKMLFIILLRMSIFGLTLSAMSRFE
jgi:hypothetical protein